MWERARATTKFDIVGFLGGCVDVSVAMTFVVVFPPGAALCAGVEAVARRHGALDHSHLV